MLLDKKEHVTKIFYLDLIFKFCNNRQVLSSLAKIITKKKNIQDKNKQIKFLVNYFNFSFINQIILLFS